MADTYVCGNLFACTLLMQSAAGKTEKSFQAESLKIGIADEDGGTFALALRTYLDNFHEVIPLENDISVMQEKLFIVMWSIL